MKEPKGALIAQTLDGGPAAKAGLNAGDVIVAVNGEPINDPREVSGKISNLNAGGEVSLSLCEMARQMSAIVKLGERPPAKGTADAEPAAHAPNLAHAPSAELNALVDRTLALRSAGKYAEAMHFGELYVAGTKARYGEDSPEYSTAIGNLAVILQEGFGKYAEV